jgi:serine transporter
MLAVPAQEFAAAARENISALAMLDNLYPGSWLGELGPAISTIALTTSFLGIFIGYREALLSVLRRWGKGGSQGELNENLLHLLTFGVLWPLAIANVPVMEILGDVVAPLGAVFMLIVPAGIIVWHVEFRADRRRGPVFSLVAGAVVLSAYFVGSAL